LDADRELLLAELLALNFHEHFEFKPLLLHADERLSKVSARDITSATRSRARDGLRSVARRVSARQIASLQAEGGEEPRQRTLQAGFLNRLGSSTPCGTKVEVLRFQDDLPSGYMPQFESDARGDFSNGMGWSPAPQMGSTAFTIVAHNPELTEETVGLDVLVWEHDQAQPSGVDFTLTGSISID
jgi:hypothetical protein